MRIAIDARPLLQKELTGVGYCESEQLKALLRLHPSDAFSLQFAAAKGILEKRARLLPYAAANATVQSVPIPSKVQRLSDVLLPLPYSAFFGSADVTHFFNYIVPFGVAGKAVVTVHDMVYKAFPETVRGRTKLMLDLGLKKSLRRAFRIVTDSQFSKEEICRYFPGVKEKIRVVPCGVNRARFRPTLDRARMESIKEKYHITGDYFLFLGTVEPRKNLTRLLDAYARFAKDTNNPPSLVVAGGSGWRNAGIYAKVGELDLQNRVHFTGYVPESDLCPLMCGALAFLFPSLYEGFGLPPLEAMACGTPVLTSNTASLPEVVGDAALLADPFDTNAIAQGLERLAKDKSLRMCLSKAGQIRAAALSWENSARLLYQVYEEACG